MRVFKCVCLCESVARMDGHMCECKGVGAFENDRHLLFASNFIPSNAI